MNFFFTVLKHFLFCSFHRTSKGWLFLACLFKWCLLNVVLTSRIFKAILIAAAKKFEFNPTPEQIQEEIEKIQKKISNVLTSFRSASQLEVWFHPLLEWGRIRNLINFPTQTIVFSGRKKADWFVQAWSLVDKLWLFRVGWSSGFGRGGTSRSSEKGLVNWPRNRSKDPFSKRWTKQASWYLCCLLGNENSLNVSYTGSLEQIEGIV